MAKWMAEKLNRATTPFTVLLPEGGVSLLDVPGQPFYDPEADTALFETLEAAIQPAAGRKIVRMPQHINDPVFATALVDAFVELSHEKQG